MNEFSKLSAVVASKNVIVTHVFIEARNGVVVISFDLFHGK